MSNINNTLSTQNLNQVLDLQKTADDFIQSTENAFKSEMSTDFANMLLDDQLSLSKVISCLTEEVEAYVLLLPVSLNEETTPSVTFIIEANGNLELKLGKEDFYNTFIQNEALQALFDKLQELV